jgi:cell wall assembly regulator SMI1
MSKPGMQSRKSDSICCMRDWTRLLDIRGYELRPGVTAEGLRRAEIRLGRALPPALASLYHESDGVFDAGGQWFVLWPLESLVKENLARWDTSLLPRRFLAFGDDGTGDPFCVEDDNPEVICWHPVDRHAMHLAPGIHSFWRGWTAGTITT